MTSFTQSEKDVIFKLAREMTGSAPDFKAEILLQNVERRMTFCKIKELVEYLHFAKHSPTELAQLVSALTIHTTSWFRENAHFVYLAKELEKRIQAMQKRKIQILSAGCSTGQEAYSLGLVCEYFRSKHPFFDYEIQGWDVDPVSLKLCQEACYSDTALAQIPPEYHAYVRPLPGGRFQPDAAVTLRTRFLRAHLNARQAHAVGAFDFVFCRNVLIYFDRPTVSEIVQYFYEYLNKEGLIFLGHSESVEKLPSGLRRVAPSILGKGMALTEAQKSGIPLVLVGASTGGPPAVSTLLRHLPQPCPPVVVIQHISPEFAPTLADQLSKISGLPLGRLSDGELLKPSTLYVNTDHRHLLLKKQGQNIRIQFWDGPPLHNIKPAIDVTFESVALLSPLRVCAFIMTGMGKDGAKGLLELRKTGALTYAQNEESSVIYGMPKEAAALGAAMKVGSPQDLNMLLRDFIADVSVQRDAYLKNPTPGAVAS